MPNPCKFAAKLDCFRTGRRGQDFIVHGGGGGGGGDRSKKQRSSAGEVGVVGDRQTNWIKFILFVCLAPSRNHSHR